MPNGRTKLFKISTQELIDLLDGMADAVIIGNSFGGDRKDYLKSDIVELIQSHTEPEIWAEEQYYEFYIVHIGADHGKWLVVRYDDSNEFFFWGLHQLALQRSMRFSK